MLPPPPPPLPRPRACAHHCPLSAVSSVWALRPLHRNDLVRSSVARLGSVCAGVWDGLDGYNHAPGRNDKVPLQSQQLRVRAPAESSGGRSRSEGRFSFPPAGVPSFDGSNRARELEGVGEGGKPTTSHDGPRMFVGGNLYRCLVAPACCPGEECESLYLVLLRRSGRSISCCFILSGYLPGDQISPPRHSHILKTIPHRKAVSVGGEPLLPKMPLGGCGPVPIMVRLLGRCLLHSLA